MTPQLIIHGGHAAHGLPPEKQAEMQAALAAIAREAHNFLVERSALEGVAFAVQMLEDHPLFNAGTGSKLQADGVIRMSAAVMDGGVQRFAGVINIEAVKNPVLIARALLAEDDRVLEGAHATAFARSLGYGVHDPLTPLRAEEHARGREAAQQSGTVGCVALDADGRLAAATSTGGKGYERPGRVSDSATVAGNYASAYAAVSCTGIGEDIVNAALAARVAVRVEDGLTLAQACERSIEALRGIGGSAGLIALDGCGNRYVCATAPVLTYAAFDGERMEVFG